MKKILVFLFFFACEKTFSQAYDPLFANIQGDIMFIGVSHTSDTVDKSMTALIDSSSNLLFCELYDTLSKHIGKKEVVFLVEGFNPNIRFRVTEYSRQKYHFPACIPVGSLLQGCDSRLRDSAIAMRTKVLMSLMRRVINLDTLTGKEKSIQDFYSAKSTLSLERFDPSDLQYFFDTYLEVAKSNYEFENTILTEAYALRQNGYFVIVFCGGSHVVKILSEHTLENAGYIFLIRQKDIGLGQMVKTAKLLQAIESYK